MNKILYLVLFAVLFLSCSGDKVAGTISDTDTGKSAMVYNADLTPAVGAVVKFFEINDTISSFETKTNDNGQYTFAGLAKGTYNVIANKDSSIAFQDSVFISASANSLVPDTLGKSGSFTGVVGLQVNHNPGTVTVQVLGTDIYSEVDSKGWFTLEPLAKGEYNLRLVSTLPDYSPTFKSIKVQGSKKDTLSDTIFLKYTGIPVITGLSISYDTLNGVVQLSWNKGSYYDFQDYLIFRDDFDSINLSNLPVAARDDTVFTDTIFQRRLISGAFSFNDTNDYHFKYRVAVRSNVTAIGQTYKFIDIVAISPIKKAKTTVLFRSVINSAPFSSRSGHTAIVFNDKLWVIGGVGELLKKYKDVWSSTDGFTWELETDNPGISPRSGSASVVFHNKIWIIGGRDSVSRLHDVWNSTDGKTWTLATSNAGFPNRSGNTCVVYDNKMWVIGGDDGSCSGDGSCYVNTKNDIWYSSDGVVWSLATANAAFSPRAGHSTVVFDNKIWVIGGNDVSINNDCWYSPDGKTWVQTVENEIFYEHSIVVLGDKMWAIGRGLYSDVWYSTDGINWKQASKYETFLAARESTTVVSFLGKIWAIGGDVPSVVYTFFNDIGCYNPVP